MHSKEQTTHFRIGGMHCSSCTLKLEECLGAVPGVLKATVNHRNGEAKITAHAEHLPRSEDIRKAIEDAGYAFNAEEADVWWLETGGALAVILIGYMLLRQFDILSLAPAADAGLTFGSTFIIGLIAGTSSCLAVTGGMLLALAAQHNAAHHHRTAWRRALPLVHFNVGRVVSYAVFGGVIGAIGSAFTLSPAASGILNVIVALMMLWLALHILGITSRLPWLPALPRAWSRSIIKLSESHHPAAPFALGALTFFLPCGFTQSLQLVALASGSAFQGSLTMFVFALGTLPALAGLSAVSATATGTFSRVFLRFSGVLVLMLSLYNLQNGLALVGVSLPSAMPTAGIVAPPAGAQEVTMSVTGHGYVPDTLTIRAGERVRWKVDGTQSSGCTSVLTIPSLGVSQALARGENIIEFTAPATPGQLPFMCSMGMVRGAFIVI